MKRIVLLFGIFLTSISMAISQPMLDDKDIADAIQDEYRFDHAVNVNQVDVNVTDGIVELTGEVKNLKAKERAQKIAMLVKGVRSVSNRIEVKPPVDMTDMGIEDNVEHALLMDPAADSYEITVSVSDNVVQLNGVVDSYQEKQLAGDVAKSVKGVVDVNNSINVDYKSDRPDSEIKFEIEEALKWNAMVEDGLIDVSVNDGDVKLSGIVGSAAEKSNAYFTAWVAGVDFVNNDELEVKWWTDDADLRKNKYTTKPDEDIEQAIKDAALYDPRVYSFNITPEVDAGWVTLRGTVDNLKAKTAAGKLAKNTTGVKGVTNRIKVRVDQQPTDREIETDINNALLNNSITETWEIGVDVNNGIATLTGLVDSYLEKMEAEWTASGVEGVNEVNNNLTVSYPYSYYWWGHYPYYTLYHTPPNESDIPTVYYPNDEVIKENVESELWWSPFVDRDQVEVEVNNGNVVLKGTVDSWREFRKATENAWEGGAWSVDNKLVVK